jgi:capsular polysaccharide biosynthesis protein
MYSKEFSLYEYFTRVIDLWWLVALATFLGGAFGYIFYLLQPPQYEATATYIVTINLDRFPFQGVREDLIQYNEDMAEGTAQDALLSREVLDNVVTQLNSEGIFLTYNDLVKNSTIERKLDVWELRYRNQDPIIAKKIVDAWSEIGYQAMLSWQDSGKAPDYIIFQSPNLADIPQRPVIYDRNKVILAGALIGFILGVLSASLISHAQKKALLESQ